jgi:hypothetical protein
MWQGSDVYNLVLEQISPLLFRKKPSADMETPEGDVLKILLFL